MANEAQREERMKDMVSENKLPHCGGTGDKPGPGVQSCGELCLAVLLHTAFIYQNSPSCVCVYVSFLSARHRIPRGVILFQPHSNPWGRYNDLHPTEEDTEAWTHEMHRLSSTWLKSDSNAAPKMDVFNYFYDCCCAYIHSEKFTVSLCELQ